MPTIPTTFTAAIVVNTQNVSWSLTVPLDATRTRTVIARKSTPWTTGQFPQANEIVYDASGTIATTLTGTDAVGGAGMWFYRAWTYDATGKRSDPKDPSGGTVYVYGAGVPSITKFGSVSNPKGLPGIESKIIFNGLTINDRSLAETYYITEIDWGDPEVRDRREAIPNQHGEKVYRMLYAGRTISLTGYIRSGNMSMMRSMQDTLRKTFSSTVERTMAVIPFQGESLYISVRRLTVSMKAERPQGTGYFVVPFQITLRAGDPRFRSAALTRQEVTFASGFSFTCTSSGNFPAEPVISIGNGATTSITISSPSVLNQTTGEGIMYSSSLPCGTGEWTTLDTRGNAPTCRNQAEESMWQTLYPGSGSFPRIVPGANTIKLSAASIPPGSPKCVVEWNDSWI